MTGHLCHWPGCQTEIPENLHMCRTHWLRVPNPMRTHLLRLNEPGQETTKRPSAAYLDAAMRIRRWALEHPDTTVT